MIDTVLLYADNSSFSLQITELFNSLSFLSGIKIKALEHTPQEIKKNEVVFIVSQDTSAILAKLPQTDIGNVTLISSTGNQNRSPDLYAIIGAQRHLLPNDYLFPSICQFLGEIKGDVSISEPIIRESTTIIFNSNVIRSSELNNTSNTNHSGLFSEDATQLFRYAGMSESNRFVLLQNFNVDDIQLITQFIWYYCEAATNRLPDHPYFRNSVNEYVVNLESIKEPVSFFKSKISGRWWVKAPNTEENKWNACSYEDYQAACNNEISDSLFNSLLKV